MIQKKAKALTSYSREFAQVSQFPYVVFSFRIVHRQQLSLSASRLYK